MRKCVCVSIIILTALNAYSQDSSSYLIQQKSIPVHFIKIDLLKSAFFQLHFNYEYFHGKHFAEEIGVSMFYPNRILSFLNEEAETTDFGPFDWTAGHYKGFGFELREKYYFPQKHWNPYLSLALTYKYKHCEKANILVIDGFRSSSYSEYELVSSKRNVYSAAIMTGFTSDMSGLCIDASLGLGLGYFSFWTKREDDAKWYRIKPGHSHFYAPVFKCGFKLCFAYKKKIRE